MSLSIFKFAGGWWVWCWDYCEGKSFFKEFGKGQSKAIKVDKQQSFEHDFLNLLKNQTLLASLDQNNSCGTYII